MRWFVGKRYVSGPACCVGQPKKTFPRLCRCRRYFGKNRIDKAFVNRVKKIEADQTKLVLLAAIKGIGGNTQAWLVAGVPERDN